MFSLVISLQFLNLLSDFVIAFVHKLYTELSNVIYNVVFILFDVHVFFITCIKRSLSHSPRVTA